MALIKNNRFEYTPDGGLSVGEFKISPSDYTVTFTPLFENEDIWSEKELVVSICLDISEDLKIEGTARNLNRYIQDLRKKIDLPYDARIILSIEARGLYQQSLATHEKWLMEQSLAVDLKDSVGDVMFKKIDDDGQLKIQIQKVS